MEFGKERAHLLFNGLVDQVGGLELLFLLVFDCHLNILICFVLCIVVIDNIEGSLEFSSLVFFKLLGKDAQCHGNENNTDFPGKLVLCFHVAFFYFPIDSKFRELHVIVENLGLSD